jgi:hypothetical protein
MTRTIFAALAAFNAKPATPTTTAGAAHPLFSNEPSEK